MNINNISKFSGSLAAALKNAILGLGGESGELYHSPGILHGPDGFHYGDIAGPGHGRVIYSLEEGLAEILGHNCIPAHEVCRTRNVDFLSRQLARVLYTDALNRVDAARQLEEDIILAATLGDWTFIGESAKTPDTALQALNGDGWTLVHYAASQGMVHRVPSEMLTGETLTLLAVDGRTPLELAEEFGEVLPHRISTLLVGAPTPLPDLGMD